MPPGSKHKLSKRHAKSLAMYCDPCSDDRVFERRLVQQTICVRGEAIKAASPMLVCSTCGNPQPDHTCSTDTLQPFYEEYRRRRHLLTPAEIRKIREDLDLSHEAFAALLGMSPATLHRYEGGAIQDEAYDNLIRLASDPANLDRLLAVRQDRLTPKWHKDLTDAIGRIRGPSLIGAVSGSRASG